MLHLGWHQRIWVYLAKGAPSPPPQAEWPLPGPSRSRMGKATLATPGLGNLQMFHHHHHSSPPRLARMKDLFTMRSFAMEGNGLLNLSLGGRLPSAAGIQFIPHAAPPWAGWVPEGLGNWSSAQLLGKQHIGGGSGTASCLYPKGKGRREGSGEQGSWAARFGRVAPLGRFSRGSPAQNGSWRSSGL